MRHNHIRDTEAKLMKEVCHDVQIEPMLIALEEEEIMRRRTNTTPHARLDISARGVWSPFDRSFIDVRVSHPNCPSNRNKALDKIYQENENEKKALYNERVINVERGNFTPLVFLTTGGMSKECMRFNNRLADLLAKKKNERYTDVVSCIRTKLRFAMLKSTLVAIRGHRGKTYNNQTAIADLCFNLIPTGSLMD